MLNKEDLQWRDANIKALTPFIVFVIFYFGISIYAKDFSKVPMTVTFLVSSFAALILNHRERLSRKIEIFAYGMSNRDIMIMCLVFILAGIFTASAKAAGGTEAAALIAQYFIPEQFMVFGIFIVSALISLSIGTSCGTITAIIPIAVSISQAFGINPSFVLGAAVGGAMFGDNVSLISDTTIAASRTQNVNMRDEMLANFKVVIIPAILCALFYMLPIFSGNTAPHSELNLSFENFIKVCPYILLLVLGALNVNVMLLLFLGTILNIIIGISFGMFNIFDALEYLGTGIESMSSTIIVAMLAGGLLQVVRYNGGVDYIIKKTSNFIKSKRTCELGICALAGSINLFTANNTVAIITSGPIAKELAVKYNVSAVRTASLLDTTSCLVQGLIPYGAQILIATSLAASIGVSSFSILKGMYYPIFVFFGVLFSILKTNEKKC